MAGNQVVWGPEVFGEVDGAEVDVGGDGIKGADLALITFLGNYPGVRQGVCSAFHVRNAERAVRVGDGAVVVVSEELDQGAC